MKKIYVTKSYLPPFKEYVQKISTIWDTHVLTNSGPIHNEFIDKLKEYLNVNNLEYVSNGTIAIELALDSLDVKDGEIITTPFTFVATSTAIVWQRCKPIFVDIKSDDFSINPVEVEKKINKNTKAILAVHCFGFPCDVESLDIISKKYNIPVIYDAAHAFGVKINKKSIFDYGTISTCSLHSTKVFHSVEGGLCISTNSDIIEKIRIVKNFGIDKLEQKYVGINAKNSEFHSAMGLCVLEHINEIIKKRKKSYDLYTEQLDKYVCIPKLKEKITYNYIYYPVLFKNEDELLAVFERLNKNDIYPRRYFYPSLNELPIFNSDSITPIASDISKRIACLPMDTYLEDEDIKIICNIIKDTVKERN